MDISYKPITNFKESGIDLGNIYTTKTYVQDLYPELLNLNSTPYVWSSGFNTNGGLGDGTTVNKSSPVTAAGNIDGWTEISSSTTGTEYSAAGIAYNGVLWTWGANTNGQLGTGNTTSRSSPGVTSPTGTRWIKVASNYLNLFSITSVGALYATGDNSAGQLGNGGTGNSTSMTLISSGTWTDIACSYKYTAGLTLDDRIWTWGANNYGQLGNGNTTSRSAPASIAGNSTGWKQISCGYTEMAAVKIDGTLWTWGFNSTGQLGDGTTTNRSSPGTTAGGGTNWKQVSCGQYCMSAIKTDGTLWTWGINSSGILGDGTTTNRSSPGNTAGGGTNWRFVNIGHFSAAAIKTDGTLWTWGANTNGQLGTGNTTSRSSPGTTAAGGNTWKKVSIGGNLLAIKSL